MSALVERFCPECEGGAERCAREGHVRAEGYEVESTDPACATFVCPRCDARFTVPRCAGCGKLVILPA